MKKKLINLLFEEEKEKSAVCSGDNSKDEDKLIDEDQETIEEISAPNPICKGIKAAKKLESVNSRFEFSNFVKKVIKEHGWYDEEKGYETMADMKFADQLDMEEFGSQSLPPDASEEQITQAELEDDWYLGQADAAMDNIDQMLYRDNDAYRRGCDGDPL